MKKILVVSHDAGGAEILSSLVRAERHCCEWRVIVHQDAPSFKIFKKKNLQDLMEESVCEARASQWLDRIRPDFLFCGTGWANRDFEGQFRLEAKKRSIKTIAFLDHWIHYRERFGYPKAGWERDLADYIAIGDTKADEITRRLNIPNVIKVKNYYFEDIINTYRELENSGTSRADALLVFSEPVVEYVTKRFGNPDYYGFTEHQLVDTILGHFEAMAAHYGLKRAVVRLHPSEDQHKYDYLRKKYPVLDLAIEDPSVVDLLVSINKARLAIGFESMPLFISYLVGKQFISYIPIKRQCDIPLPEENRISDMSDFVRVDHKNLRLASRELLFGEQYNLRNMFSMIESEGC